MYLLSTVLFILVKSKKEKSALGDSHISGPFICFSHFPFSNFSYFLDLHASLSFLWHFPNNLPLLLLPNHLPNHESLVYTASVNLGERVHFV